MTKERVLLQRLLEGAIRGDFYISEEVGDEIEAILAQPEQSNEPVAWYWEQSDFYNPEWYYLADTGDKPVKNRFRRNIQPLYLSPPKREPIAYVADSSVGFDVSRSVQGMPLLWVGKLNYGDKLYIIGKDDE